MTPKLGSFKLGPAKTRDGSDAEILKIVEGPYPLIGMLHLEHWHSTNWKQDGSAFNPCYSILPNCEPERVKFESYVYGKLSRACDQEKIAFLRDDDGLVPLIGKHCRVTVEVLDV